MKISLDVDSENAPPRNYSSTTALSPKVANFANRSPNNNSNSNSNNERTDKDEIFQLQIEIQSLKNRLKLSSSAQKNELLELLSEKETVIHTKSKQISALNDKFHKITKAVSQMEREVILLRKDNAALQEDNKKLKRHLNIREKEVTALVTRCTAQEEKLSEGKSSRMIEKQLKELQVKFHSSQEQLKQLDSLQEKLVRSEAERDAASGKIDRLFVENKDLGQHIVDTKQRLELQLDSRDVSLHAMKRQMQDLVGLKEEHGKRCDSLSAELKECHAQMQTMEGTIQGMKLAHRDEIVLMEKLLMERNSEEVSKHQQQQQDILETLTIAKDDEIMELKRQLKDGDAALAAVLKDVVTLKQENEQVTQDRDVVQMEKNEMIEDHRKEKESHTKEVAIWSTLAETKTEEIDLLNGTLQELENNKSHTTGQTSQLKEQIRCLEDQISALTVREMALVKADRIAAQTIQHLQGDLQDMEKVRSCCCCCCCSTKRGFSYTIAQFNRLVHHVFTRLFVFVCRWRWKWNRTTSPSLPMPKRKCRHSKTSMRTCYSRARGSSRNKMRNTNPNVAR